MTLTIEVPDETGERLAALPTETVTRYAVAALQDLVFHADAIAADEAECRAVVEEALADIDANGMKNTFSLEEVRQVGDSEKAARRQAKLAGLAKAA